MLSVSTFSGSFAMVSPPLSAQYRYTISSNPTIISSFDIVKGMSAFPWNDRI